MVNENAAVGGTIGTFLSAVGASMSITEIQAIVSIVVTILGFIITVLTAFVIPTWKKWKHAKEDGKVTPEELEDIVDTAKKGLEEISRKTDDLDEKK